ncbi:hypothetical protein [Kitasatospora viridis]|uniref:Uncharacterized protein n=1 Tax=Kitasatospora viridis TaxID=281105 RepID=A0A561UPQ4_9ACTN|nr:hypothetical protein [Kitasatospora viridis]TWG01349.1 hypothetical protein FHX73_115241 [Kitasatospora viridis]
MSILTIARHVRHQPAAAQHHPQHHPQDRGPQPRGCLRLTLRDGAARLYLLDARDFAATTSPEVAYDARIHTAYLLAVQGHRPEWLAQHLDLPVDAVRRIAEHAAQFGPAGPGTRPPE